MLIDVFKFGFFIQQITIQGPKSTPNNHENYNGQSAIAPNIDFTIKVKNYSKRPESQS